MKKKNIASLDRANRVLTMLSRINRTIIRAESPDTLYREACRIAVECGMFRFAWIGMVDSVSGDIRLMTSHGDPCGDEASLVASGGLADVVRQSGRLCIYNDLMTLPDHMGRMELFKRGFHAMAGLPLSEDGKAIGVFLLYTDQTECFDETVVELMHEVADDIGFSLGHILNDQRRLAAESKLYYLAFYDAQTGMPNRALLDERLPVLAQRLGDMLVLDIRVHRVDKVTEAFSRPIAEGVLRSLASRLDAFRGNEGFLATLAQDEFVLVVPTPAGDAGIDALAQDILHLVEQPLAFSGGEIFLHASVGVVRYPDQETDPAQLLRRARVSADSTGAGYGYRLYSSELDHGSEQRVQMEIELHKALERGEFRLYYQPQLDINSGHMVGMEALLQWQHPERGMLSPGVFIPLLEECGLMPQVGAWVLQTACAQAREWQDSGLPSVRMAVNVSALQFRMANLTSVVCSALKSAGLEARWLELELTESLILENAEATIGAMHELKALGVTLSLDDFGTGYCSLSYLRRYPMDRLKIDRSFVNDMIEHAGSAELVRAILAMAKALRLNTIAEGVETEEQLHYLLEQGCDEMQGYFFSKPVPPEDVRVLLSNCAALPKPRQSPGN
jgi:EAL domain-containing protein (putative c-di-GMP-specific phosphodiesterase class I)/GGDEF domain-containing protein